jgi:SAM-dependent methyltransferase
MTCRDHTVSYETFNIVSCTHCGFVFTNPIPDKEELGKYYQSDDYISHSDTSKGLISKAYKAVRAYALRKKLAMVSDLVPRGTMLDYGCGTGSFLSLAKSKGWKVRGVEPSDTARSVAANRGVEAAPDYSQIGAGTVFDAITLWHVLEHVYDLNATLEWFKGSLSSNGVLVVAVPNHRSYDALHYESVWAAYDVPRHLYHFDRKSLPALMEKHGFKLESIEPMKFDSFYVSMLSEKYKGGSLIGALYHGLRSNIQASRSGEYSSLVYIFRKA